MPNDKSLTLLEKLLQDAKENKIKITIKTIDRYHYHIDFQQPWHIQHIDAYCSVELIAEFMN